MKPHIFIRKSDNSNSQLTYDERPVSVIFPLVFMHAAVNLHDNLSIITVEIGDKESHHAVHFKFNDMLTVKPDTIKFPISHQLPELPFGGS